MTKAELVAASPEGHIDQPGGGYLGDRLEIPTPTAERVGETPEHRIETFLVGDDGLTPTGDDQQLIEYFSPLATTMATQVLAALDAAQVRHSGTGYLSASLSPSPDLVGLPHVDDDRFDPEAGVGIVAILGTIEGPRIATEPVPCTAQPGLPIGLNDDTIGQLRTGTIAFQQAEPSRIVLLPQFGQLHAGPDLRELTPPELRASLVLRITT